MRAIASGVAAPLCRRAGSMYGSSISGDSSAVLGGIVSRIVRPIQRTMLPTVLRMNSDSPRYLREAIVGETIREIAR
jgi:hypothetical protein